MNVRHTLLAAAMLAVAGIANAHDCSGGTGGGMDATGNDCGEVATVAAAPVAPAAIRSDAASPGGVKAARRDATRAPRNTIATAGRVARGNGAGR